MSDEYPQLDEILIKNVSYDDRTHDRVIDVQTYWYNVDGDRERDSQLARAGGPSEVSVVHQGWDSGGPDLKIIGGEWLEP